MPDLARGATIDLPYGISISSTNVQAEIGDVRVVPGSAGSTRTTVARGLSGVLGSAFAALDPGPAAVLEAAAEEAGFGLFAAIPVDNIAVPVRRSTATRRSNPRPVELTMRIPAPPPDQGQVILEVDASGVSQWHFAAPTAASDRASSTRRAVAATQIFTIPMMQFTLETAGNQSVRGFGWRKFLHVLRYPLVKLGEFLVERWEQKNRRHQLLQVVPSRLIDGAALHPIGTGWFRSRVNDPFLLLIHGTFSSTYGGFDSLLSDPSWLSAAVRTYGDNIIAFDHPTVSVTPDVNAVNLLNALPAEQPLDVDVICHSRGGLVSRALMTPGLAQGIPTPRVDKLIHVAVPNNGTPLANAGRWRDLLNIFTNALALLPTGPVTVSISVVMEVVKQVGTGVFERLDGLAAMATENNPWLTDLNKNAAPKGARAVRSDYNPVPGFNPINALNRLADGFFASTNDLVVPTDGVARAGKFVIPDPLVITTPSSVWHCSYFAEPAIRKTISTWLGA